MMIVCISSHGAANGRIISSDCLELDLEQDILRRFNNLFCPKLKGKPKFFLVQACRGDDVDFGLSESVSRRLRIEDTDSRKTKLTNRPRSLTFSEIPMSTKVNTAGM